jgi:hypothetical protein
VVVRAPPRDPAAVGAQDAERDAHRGGLAGAVRAEKAEHVRFRDLELQPIECSDRPELLREAVDR